MRISAALCVGLALLGGASPVAAACLGEAEIDAAVGTQIRARANILDTSALTGRVLCSGLTLAQQIQRMRESAFPEERAAREAEASRIVALQAESARLAAVEAARRPARVQQAGATPRAVRATRGSVVITTAATGLSLDELLDRAVQADSSSWMMNRYVAGSMREARYLSTNKARTSYVARGVYDYNGMGGGRTGWVKIKVVGGDLNCFEYHDQPGVCRRPWASLGQQNMLGLTGAMMSGGGGSGSSRRDDYPDDLERNRGSSSSPPPQPTRMTPIGGEGGLYGCASPPCM